MRLFYILLFFTVTFSLANDLQKVSLQLQWKHQFQFAGYYIAKEKGFYKKAGIDVEIKEFEYGMNVPNEIINKNSTFGVGRPTLIINRSQGDNVVLLASIFQSSPNVIIANPTSNIKSVKDFKNKKLMVTGDAKADATIMSMVFANGLKIDDLNILEHSFNINDLINNTTDLMSSYISNEPFLLKEKGLEGTIFDPKDYGFDFYNDILFTTSEFIDKNPIITNKFTKASLEGWKYAFENIEETVQIILDKYNTQNKSYNALIYEGRALQKLAYYKTDKLGHIDPLKIDRIYTTYKLMGFTKNELDMKEFLYNSSLLRLSKEEKQYLKEIDYISMCIDPDWMPFEKFDINGKHIGMSAEYFELIQKTLKTPIKVIPTKTWTQSLEYAKNRECDILSLAMKTSQREKFLDFTKPYINVPVVLATKLDTTFIDDVKMIKNKKIGVVKNYAISSILKKEYKNFKLVEVNSVKEGLDLVAQGKLFGFVDTSVTIGKLIQSNFLSELKISARLDEQINLAIAVRSDNPTLRNILDKIVDTIPESTKKEIMDKHIAIVYDKKINYNLIIYPLIVIFIIVLFLAYRQHRLTQSLQDISEIIDSTMEAIIISKNFKCIDINKSALKLFNASSKEEFIGKPLIDFFADTSKELVKENMLLDDVMPYECFVQKNDKTIFPALVRGHNIRGKDLRISSILDISHIKQMESQAKLASMGEMIGNIAHQWRQPLSIISASAGGIEIKHEAGILDDKYLIETLEHIKKNSQYLSETIDTFRDFLKTDKDKTGFVLETVVLQSIQLVQSNLQNNHITLNLPEDFDSRDTCLIGRDSELSQVIINILNNAKDVLLENKIENPSIDINVYQEDNNNIITIEDNAGGVPSNIIDKIFEPYFTTKHKSQGTGLGLHMSYKIITESFGGNISVQNTNNGAKFIIDIPNL